MSRRLRLGLDIDGVIYDWFGAYRYLANHHLAAGLPPVEQIWDGSRTDADFLTPDQQKWMWSHGVRFGLFRYGHIIKGAVEALREISASWDIVIITHRPTSWHIDVPEESRQKGTKDTMAWLALLAEDVRFVETHIIEKTVPKSSIVCDAYIDDGVHVMEDLLANTPPETLLLLFDQPWNRSVWAEGWRPIRIHSWDGVVPLLTKYLSQAKLLSRTDR